MKYVYENNANLKGILEEIKKGTEPTYSIYNKAGRRVLYNFDTNTAVLTILDSGKEDPNPFYKPVEEKVEEPEIKFEEEVAKEEVPAEKVEAEVTPCDSEGSMEANNDEPKDSMEVAIESNQEHSDSSDDGETINETVVDEPKVEEETSSVEEDRKEEDESLQQNEGIIGEVQSIIESTEPNEPIAKEEIPEPEVPVEEEEHEPEEPPVEEPVSPEDIKEAIEAIATPDPIVEQYEETKEEDEGYTEQTDEDRQEIEEALELYRAFKVIKKYLNK